MKISNTSIRIREIMDKEHLKQVDILEKAKPFSSKYDTKISKADLSQYVSGKVKPGQAKLFALANALNVNEAWLMGYDVPKDRNSYIISDHSEISDSTLLAIQELAGKSGYTLSYFAKQYQITFNDCIVKLSPKEVSDLITCSIEQINFVMKSIINNKLKDNIVPIRSDIEINAAHDIPNASIEDIIHDEQIMDDENF